VGEGEGEEVRAGGEEGIFSRLVREKYSWNGKELVKRKGTIAIGLISEPARV